MYVNIVITGPGPAGANAPQYQIANQHYETLEEAQNAARNMMTRYMQQGYVTYRVGTYKLEGTMVPPQPSTMFNFVPANEEQE